MSGSFGLLWFCEALTRCHFEQHTKGRGSTGAFWGDTVHMQTFYHSLLMVVAFKLLTESLSIRLTVARRNFYQPVLSVSTVTVPSWRRGFLSWQCILRTVLSGWRFLFVICGAIAVIVLKYDLPDYRGALWWIPPPLLPWDDGHWSRHQHLYSMT